MDALLIGSYAVVLLERDPARAKLVDGLFDVFDGKVQDGIRGWAVSGPLG